MSESQQLQAEDPNRQHNISIGVNGGNQLIEFHECFYNTDISSMEISNLVSNDSNSSSSSINLVFDDSNSSSSSSTSSVSSTSGYIPRSIKQRVKTYLDTTTMEVGDDSTFQSHVKSIINTQKPGTTELFMSSWQSQLLKFMIQITQGSFRIPQRLAYSKINSHPSMLNQLLFKLGPSGFDIGIGLCTDLKFGSTWTFNPLATS
ncbi:hypothetical protein ACTFIU_003719 [Dictyostelium citrinum]